MTNTTINELIEFLKVTDLGPDPKKIRCADYGGTDNIGSRVVPKILKQVGVVDYHMLDFDNGYDLRKPIKGKKFNLGICMDLMEHVSDPFLVAKNIMDSLQPGSLFFITVPYSWPVHGYPNDYWRFTPEGLEELFKPMNKLAMYALYDTYVPPEELPAEAMAPKLPWIRIFAVFQKKLPAKKKAAKKKK